MYKEIFLNNIKDVLYYAYKYDLSFPRSCGLVSMILTYLFGSNETFTQKYDISCVRGCFRDPEGEDYCEDFFEDMYRYNCESEDFLSCGCHNCGACTLMTPHSWIEIKNRITDEVTILDFTSIQFEENFPDYQNDLLGKYTLDELYTYIKERSKFVIKEDDNIFDYYIPLSSIENYKTVINKTDELRGTKFTNPILDYLEEHNL